MAATIKQAESETGYPASWIKRACDEGGARTQGGRIDIAKVREWIEPRTGELSEMKEDLPLREQKLVEEVRKLRLKNDKDAGKLVEVAWVHECLHRVAGEVNAIRVKSEAEDPVRLAEAGHDVALNRSVLRGVWDGIFKSIQKCKEQFAE